MKAFKLKKPVVYVSIFCHSLIDWSIDWSIHLLSMYFFYSDVFQVTLLPHMTDSAQIFFQKMEGMNPSPPLSNKPPFSLSPPPLP